jgi:FkbM family methyltransferase
MLNTLKNLIKKLPFDFTKNQAYDTQTNAVIKQVCKQDSNCLDIGCHKGEVMDIILRYAPEGRHFGFEPIPHMYKDLIAKYKGTKCTIHEVALSHKAGVSVFNHVVSNPAYSGLVKRSYDRPNEVDEQIEVRTEKLDTLFDKGMQIDLIKIDVEGGELNVLKGAVETIKRTKPVIIFEHGLGASEFYGSSPEKVFALFTELNYNVSLMKSWLDGKSAYNLEQFKNQFYNKKNYYFIAYPK